MTTATVQEGKTPFNVQSLDGLDCFTYYRIVGNIKCGTPPLLMVHGGPGAGHEYLLSYSELWPQYGIPVVFFDHIGCGSSTHLRHKANDKTFWTPQLSIAQLNSIIDHLKLREGPGFYCLAHSFGGMIVSNWAGSQPRGLRKLILAGTAASKDLSMRGIRSRLKELPLQSQEAIYTGEQNEDYDDPAYKAAIGEYFKTFLCRADPLPQGVVKANTNLAEDKTVFTAMSGPAFLKHTGSMIGWSSIPTLHKINVPTLVFHGEFDTAPDICQAPFFQHIPRVRWVTVPGGGHMCHVEEYGRKERVLRLVGEFLTQSC